MSDVLQDTAAYIGLQVKGLMEQIAEIDTYLPDEDQVEILIGSVSAWGTIEAQVLYPAIAIAFEEAEPTIEAARERLNTLHALEESIHTGEGAEGPFTELAIEYLNAVKYHLVVDVQEFVPLAQQLPIDISHDLAREMAALKLELE
jgi:hypothetical protein